MTAPVIKPERKRLDWSGQTGVDQTEIRINPAPETRNHPQVVRHDTTCPRGLIGAKNSDKMQGKAFYLGNVVLND
jgi:hypothetical protein